MHISFINLFIIPLIGMYLFLRKKQFSMTFSFEMLFFYAYFTCLNIPATHFFLILVRKFLGKMIVTESAFYTLLAFVSTVIVFFCSYIISECLRIELKINKKDEKKE